MSDVKRYDICGYDGYPEPDDSGYYVTYDDYAALRARLAEVENERDALIVARDMMGRLWEQEKGRAERAEAEITRLRAQLEQEQAFTRLAKTRAEAAEARAALAAFDTTTGGKDE
jgi:hypothetical protein